MNFDIIIKSVKPNTPILERWPSGLRHSPGKTAMGKLIREFESLPLRQFSYGKALLLVGLIYFCAALADA